MADKKQDQAQIQIKAQDDVLKGVYANAAQVSHNKEEFVFDFMNIYPWQRLGMLNSRVIVSPGHMKRLVRVLEDNIKKYEEKFGTIAEGEDVAQSGLGFQTE